MYAPFAISVLSLITSAYGQACWGSTFSWNDNILRSGNVTQTLYQSCRELSDTGAVVSTHAVCVSNALSFMLQALVLSNQTQGVDSIGTNSAQIFWNTTRNGTAPVKRSASRMYRARLVDVAPSAIIPSGVVLRTNVYCEGKVLSKHYNLTHSIVQFDDFENGIISPRERFSTRSHNFTFEKVSGMKVEAIAKTGAKLRAFPTLSDDVRAFATCFAYFNGGSPRFLAGDEWSYSVCDESQTRMFAGKIITELKRPGRNFEPFNPPVCAAANPVLAALGRPHVHRG